MMKALLRMFAETDDGAVDHFVREWMRQVRELSYDGEDCIEIFFTRINWAPRSANPFLGFFHWLATLSPRHSLANDIEALRARAIAISERQGRFGVYGQELQPSAAFGARIPTSSTPPVIDENHGQFIGMEAQIATFSDVLNGGDPHDPERKVCSIVGIGGVGKSTLALRVFRNIEHHFDCRAFVTVSQQFDPRKDLHGLMARIHNQLGYVGNEAAGGFADYLEERRYLIAIDDVWTISAWHAIRQELAAVNNMRSRIVLTTRIENVAAACSTPSPNGRYIHRVNLLGNEHSRTLFVRRVFGHAPANAPAAAQNDGQLFPDAPDELQVEMGIILQKCGGLPLAIVCIANVLARYNSPSSKEMWKRVCNSVGSQLETNNPALEGMLQIIALSYNHLPHHLKACAMLVSIFPEDYHIPKWRLLRRWISEGLIPEKRGLTLLDVAEAYYEELFSRNIIQRAVLPDGTVSAGKCSVHDMMQEVIVSKSLEANFVSLVGSPRGGTSYDRVRRVSIHRNAGRGVEGMNMQHVRSLTTFGANVNGGVRKLLDGLSTFTLLRVLDLEDCKDVTNKHMKQVCQLFLLKLLNLNGTDISNLPGAISNLKQLQSLMLWDALLDQVPRSVVNLEKLEYLSFRKRGELIIRLRLPEGLNKMKALQRLTRLEIGARDVQLATQIGDLVQLRELQVFVLPGHSVAVQQALEGSVDRLRLHSLTEENIEIVYIGNLAPGAPAEAE